MVQNGFNMIPQCGPDNANLLLTLLLKRSTRFAYMSTAVTLNLFSLELHFSHIRFIRVTAWIIHFTMNCRNRERGDRHTGQLTASEIHHAELHWVSFVQQEQFAREITALKAGHRIPKSSSLISLSPFLDDHGLLRAGGHEHHSNRLYDIQHPLILHAKHFFTQQFISSEHKRLLHAGPTLLSFSLYRRFHII